MYGNCRVDDKSCNTGTATGSGTETGTGTGPSTAGRADPDDFPYALSGHIRTVAVHIHVFAVKHDDDCVVARAHMYVFAVQQHEDGVLVRVHMYVFAVLHHDDGVCMYLFVRSLCSIVMMVCLSMCACLYSLYDGVRVCAYVPVRYAT